MKLITSLLLVLAFVSFAGAQKSVLFLVGAGQESTGPEVSDDIVLDIMLAFEWDVETFYLDDPSLMTDSLGLDKDLVVISSTILSTHVGNFYWDKAVPILTWESGMYGKLGIASGGGNITVQEPFLFIYPEAEGHAALGSYTGEIEVLLNPPMEVTLVDTSQYSEDLQPLAEMIMDDGSPMTGIFAVEEGATLLDTTAAPARRIGFFFRDKTAEEASDDALAIMGLCLKWLMGEGETSVQDLRHEIARYQLFNNYPNPFNPSTLISFNLSQADDVTLTVYNSRGQKIKTLLSARVGEGRHTVQWKGLDDRGNSVPNGVYHYELRTRRYVERKKMVLLR